MDNAESDLENIRARVLALRTRGWRALAEASGVPFSTVRKFAYREVKKPGYDTVSAIKTALQKVEAEVVPA